MRCSWSNSFDRRPKSLQFVNFGRKLSISIFNYFYVFQPNLPMFHQYLRGIRQKRTFFGEFWTQKPTHMDGTYPYHPQFDWSQFVQFFTSKFCVEGGLCHYLSLRGNRCPLLFPCCYLRPVISCLRYWR